MKNFNSNRKNVGAASIAAKACTWILSIMLVVTGMAPSFAANVKAGNGSATKTAQAGSNKTSVTNNEYVSKKESKKSSASENKQSKGKAQREKAPDSKKISKNNNDKKADNGKTSSISPKQATALKDQVASKARTIVSNGYSSYYKNLQKSSSNSQNIKSQINTNASLKNKAASSIKQRARSSKPQKSQNKKKVDSASRYKDGNGRKKKFNKKGERIFDLNGFGNVYAVLSGTDLYIRGTSGAGSWNIYRERWGKMVRELGGAYDGSISWQDSRVENIRFDSEVGLPQDSSELFKDYGGEISVANFINTFYVTDMRAMFERTKGVSVVNFAKQLDVRAAKDFYGMFRYSTFKKIDLSKWNLDPNVVSPQNRNFREIFAECKNLEVLKLPSNFKTTLPYMGAGPFKVVEIDLEGNVSELESQWGNMQNYTVECDSDHYCNIYPTYKYAGVTFDSNGGSGGNYSNHQVVEKGKSIKDSKGSLPGVWPKKAGYSCIGWAESKTATVPDFDTNTIVNSETTVYAVWRSGDFPLNSSGNIYAALDNDSLRIKAKSTSGDMQIDGAKWQDMIKVLGASHLEKAGELTHWETDWNRSEVVVNNIYFEANGIYLQSDCSDLFKGLRGHILGCGGLNTQNVTNMHGMFYGAEKANPDVSNWNTSKVDDMKIGRAHV